MTGMKLETRSSAPPNPHPTPSLSESNKVNNSFTSRHEDLPGFELLAFFLALGAIG